MSRLDYHHIDILETPRCVLRAVAVSDASDILRLYSNPEVILYTESLHPMRNIRAAEHAIEFYRRGYMEGWMYRWGIILKSSGRLIGTSGLHRMNDEHRFTNIGYEIDSPYWNRGLTTEVVQAMTRYAFETLNMHRVEAELIPQNIGSARVAQKNGYHYEATRRQRLRKQMQFFDIDVYAILRQDWQALEQTGSKL
jgi:ribosomal-protein-alanine N-acetyltransferase